MPNTYEYRGNMAIAYLEDCSGEWPKHALEGLSDYVRDVTRNGTMHVVLDFKDIKKIVPADITEIMEAYELLRRASIGLYLCNLGDENRHPHCVVRFAGLPNLPGIEVRGSLDETVAELSQ